MSRHDANRLTYDEVTIFDVPALFTDLRVDRSTVPDGVYRYEVRYSDEYGGEPVELARGIMVDFFGTVLTRLYRPSARRLWQRQAVLYDLVAAPK